MSAPSWCRRNSLLHLPGLRHLLAPAALLIAVAALRPSALAQTIDPSFAPQPNAETYALAIQPDGKILIGGNFTAIGTISRSRLARLNPNGTVDPNFNPNVSSTVNAVAVLPDGRILVGGFFNVVGGQPRARLVRLSADGTLDLTFDPRIDNSVQAITVQPDGRILVGGYFSAVAGVARNGLARLNADGSLDAAFDPAVSGFFSSNTSSVAGCTLQPNGSILIAGNFTAVAGLPRPGLARVSASGVLDLTYEPPAFLGSSRGTLLLPDGKCLAFGSVLRLTSSTFQYIVRLNADGSQDPAFVPPAMNGAVMAAVQQPDGKLVLVGGFTEVASSPRGGVVRLNPDGSLDPSFTADFAGFLTSSGPTGYVFNVALPPGPLSIVAVGSFTSVSAQAHNGVVRFGSPLPPILRQPASVNAAPGSSVALSVASDGPDLRYQWLRNGVALPGATASTLVLTDLSAATAGIYTAAVTNPWGSTSTAPAAVTLDPPALPSFTFSTLAGTAGQTGRVDATGTAARFDHPTGLALDAAGNTYSMDTTSNFLRRISSAGSVTTVATLAGQGLAIDSGGIFYVADGVSRISRVTPAGTVTTLAGTGTPGSSDGPAATAQFRNPTGIAVDTTGTVYVADTGNFTIRQISPAGVVSTLAGIAGIAGSVDGPAGQARFFSPSGLALDAAGNLYVADRNSVRKIAPAGLVSTVAAVDAMAVAVDAAGLIYASDALAHVVRRIAPDGSIAVIAGTPGAAGSVDGAGGTARFNSPWGLALDRNGTLYLADNGNGTIRRGTPETGPLAIVFPPAITHTEAGLRATLTVSAQGPNLTYQWKKDGGAIPGATAATLLLRSPSAAADMGFYTVAVSSGGSSLESTPVLLTVSNPASPGRLINIATRGLVTAGGALTPGFVLRGTGTKQLIVRGVGPTLLRFGIGGVLADPRMELAPLGGAALLANDDWTTGGAALGPAMAAVGAFALDSGSKDAAAMTAISGGVAHTVRITGPDAAASGLALAEIYDADPLTSGAQLVNVSTRGFVGTGSSALVPGFVIGGGGPLQLLIRAVGPGLAPFGVTGVLADPQLSVVPLGKETPIASNDNWGGSATLSAAFAAAGAFSLPSDSKDAAVLVRLPPGGYTVIVSGVGATTGTALVEIYDLP